MGGGIKLMKLVFVRYSFDAEQEGTKACAELVKDCLWFWFSSVDRQIVIWNHFTLTIRPAKTLIPTLGKYGRILSQKKKDMYVKFFGKHNVYFEKSLCCTKNKPNSNCCNSKITFQNESQGEKVFVEQLFFSLLKWKIKEDTMWTISLFCLKTISVPFRIAGFRKVEGKMVTGCFFTDTRGRWSKA